MKLETYKLLLDVESGEITPEEAQIKLLNLITLTNLKKNPIVYRELMLKCKPGLYEVFWKEGGSSLAAIGITNDGQRWLAPSNWTNGSDGQEPITRLHNQLNSIDRIVLIC